MRESKSIVCVISRVVVWQAQLAEASGLHFRIDESSIPVRADVQGACELLGLDPLYVANEGRMIDFIPASEADRALALLRRSPVGADSCIIGSVGGEGRGPVTIKSRIGALPVTPSTTTTEKDRLLSCVDVSSFVRLPLS
jgi:hydrogenase maturation factor